MSEADAGSRSRARESASANVDVTRGASWGQGKTMVDGFVGGSVDLLRQTARDLFEEITAHTESAKRVTDSEGITNTRPADILETHIQDRADDLRVNMNKVLAAVDELSLAIRAAADTLAETDAAAAASINEILNEF